MGTTTDKINAILNTKGNIKKKFNEKGVAVDDSVPFSQYPNKMDELSRRGNSDKIANVSLKRSKKISMGILRDNCPQVINDNIVSVVAARQ